MSSYDMGWVGFFQYQAIADCVESILGAFFEQYGEQAAVGLLKDIGIIPVDTFPLQEFKDACMVSAEGVSLRYARNHFPEFMLEKRNVPRE